MMDTRDLGEMRRRNVAYLRFRKLVVLPKRIRRVLGSNPDGENFVFVDDSVILSRDRKVPSSIPVVVTNVFDTRRETKLERISYQVNLLVIREDFNRPVLRTWLCQAGQSIC